MKKFLIALLAGMMVCGMAFGFAACDLFTPSNNDTPTVDTPTTPQPGDKDPDKDPDKNPDEDENLVTIQQQLHYTESTAKLDNPDQGFYLPINVTVTDSGATYPTYVVTNTTKLYHLRIDISAFSANAGGTDHPLTDAALNGIRNLLTYLRQRDKSAIVRFSYDKGFDGHANFEPSLEVMLNHARQFCTVLEEYSATVTALEVGMVGPWGEMHTSTAANPENISALIQAFLENTTTIPVSVRTPQMIYNYLGISGGAPEGYEVPETAYRLGMFNDGYLGSATDYRTYGDREKDVAFISGQTEHLPFGGEVIDPNSTLHDITVCLPEMYQIHLSYLNELWNDQIVAKWKNVTVTENCADADSLYYGLTAYTYIQNHMGYRFVLKNSTFKHTENFDTLKISLTLENVGFGNLTKSKNAKLLFVNSNNAVVHEESVENFNGEETIDYSLALDLQAGNYRMFLQLSGDELNGTPLYCLQFANDSLYDTALHANLIGGIEIK